MEKAALRCLFSVETSGQRSNQIAGFYVIANALNATKNSVLNI